MLWHPSVNLSEMRLVHAPVWVLFKKVPFELWSTLGFSTMASAVGFPVHSEFPDIKPYSNGVVKLRVVIELDKPRPSLVRVTDKLGNSVTLPVEFQKLPPKCGGCGEHGHLRLRCLQPDQSKITLAMDNPPFMGVMASPLSVARNLPIVNSAAHSPLSADPAKAASHASLAISSEKGSSSKSASHEFGASYRQRKVERTRSLPLNYNSISGHLLPSGWQYVAKRSEGIKEKASSSQKVVVPVTNAKFAEEEELISAAQAILRNRLANLESNPPAHSTSLSKKQARRKIRQNLYMLSLGSEGDQLSTSSTSDAHGGTECFSLASGGQAHSRSAHSQEA